MCLGSPRENVCEMKRRLCLCSSIYVEQQPDIIFLGSGIDDFQKTALLIPINLCTAPERGQRGFPRCRTPVCQNRWANDQYVLYQTTISAPPLLLIEHHLWRCLIWYWCANLRADFLRSYGCRDFSGDSPTVTWRQCFQKDTINITVK